jgi:ABC-type antimicrobial peptide transport system permease subunit
VIDERFERRSYPNRNPVGEHLHLAGLDALFEIVGVVGHVNQRGLDENESSAGVQLYTSIDQIPEKYMQAMARSVSFVVRVQASNNGAANTIQHAIAKMNDQLVAYDFAWMDEIISASLAVRRFTMMLLTVFAALAVFLAIIGVYGVVSYVVSQRTGEIGVRMALGAGPRRVMFMVLRQAGKTVFLGAAAGLLGSLEFSRLIASMLFRVSAYDPLTLIGVSGVLAAVALLASYIPARRATRVDPMVALRYE